MYTNHFGVDFNIGRVNGLREYVQHVEWKIRPLENEYHINIRIHEPDPVDEFDDLFNLPKTLKSITISQVLVLSSPIPDRVLYFDQIEIYEMKHLGMTYQEFGEPCTWELRMIAHNMIRKK